MNPIFKNFNPTPAQRENLLKMAAFLDTLPPENLYMRKIVNAWGTAKEESELSPECNSVCCILGFTSHVLGSPPGLSMYISRTKYGVALKEHPKLWEHLFGSSNPNDPKLMAGRLREAAKV